MKLGIVGNGFVGNAMVKAFANVERLEIKGFDLKPELCEPKGCSRQKQ